MNPLMVVVFLIVFLTLYGGLHFYLYRKTKSLLPEKHKSVWPVLLLLMLIPLVSEIFTHSGWGLLIKPLAWLGYYWMGLVFLLTSSFFLLDILRWLNLFISKLARVSYYSAWFTGKKPTFAVIVYAFFMSVYGILNIDNIIIETIPIDSEYFSEQDKSFRIAQISDVHFGLLSDRQQARQIVDLLQLLNPDVIVATGDLIDMQTDHIGELADVLSQLSPPFGMYAVMGNHEAYAGVEQSKVFFQRAKFKLLSNENILIGDKINLIGVDDPAIAMLAETETVDESELLKQFMSERFTVLLKHQPVINDASTGRFNLQLSGHTHGGQIFPFSLLTRLAYKVAPGLTQITNSSWIYVSRGTGTWGPPMRIGADPEITLFEIY